MPGYRPGTRLACPVCAIEVIVTLSRARPGALTCDGSPLAATTDSTPPRPPHDPAASRTLLGRRYQAADGSLEVLCLRQGPGVLAADGAPLTLVKPKLLPASD